MKHTRGFTLLEILLVIALLLLVSALSTPLLSRFVLQNHFDTTGNHVIGSIRKAQAYAESGRDESPWGVCLYNSAIRFYSGSCVSPTYFEDFAIVSSVQVAGLSDTTFNSVGEPSAPAVITVQVANRSRSIVMNSTGALAITDSIGAPPSPTLPPTVPPSPTPTPTPSGTPTPTPTPTATPTPTPTPDARSSHGFYCVFE
ncbi:prepilin-type N-terminal cleavage/methylation domain-containing protein [Candidatus Woesebacteria bacterium]|nr:prepilin-type N-terminal cleavage/methylation domain-containing protein [Candidatus Woesebacteria bacterium]